jgi:hypothetical protein
MIGIGMGFDEDAGDADRDRGARQHRNEFAFAAGCYPLAARLLQITGAPVVRARIGSARMSDTSVL